MSKLVVHGGGNLEVTPLSAGWSYVGFEVVSLGRGDRIAREIGDRELCAVLLSGSADVSSARGRWQGVGSRTSVFDGPPDAVYLPPGDGLEVTATTDRCEVAFCWAPAESGAE